MEKNYQKKGLPCENRNAVGRRPISQGFTLIETFVAITILLIAIVGPLQLFSKYFTDVDYIKRQNTATFLAQEGVELLMANREYYLRNNFSNPDTASPNYGEKYGFEGFANSNCFSTGSSIVWCQIEPSSPMVTGQIKPCTGSYIGCPVNNSHDQMTIDTNPNANKYFSDAPADDDLIKTAPYIRRFKLEPFPDPSVGPVKVVKVTMQVDWQTRGGEWKTPGNGGIVITTYLYDGAY
jgi:type II secretory pathway pseudopilin PulG